MEKEKELKRRIAESFDPDALVDILKVTSEELVELFWPRVVAKMEEEFFYVQDDMNTHIDEEEDIDD